MIWLVIALTYCLASWLFMAIATRRECRDPKFIEAITAKGMTPWSLGWRIIAGPFYLPVVLWRNVPGAVGKWAMGQTKAGK